MRKVYAFMIATMFALAIASPGVVLAQSDNSTSRAKATRVGELLDINTASKAQLDALPGIGPAYSQKIIDNRPYRTKQDLLTKNVIPQSTYNRIRDQIIAHPPTGGMAQPTGKP